MATPAATNASPSLFQRVVYRLAWLIVRALTRMLYRHRVTGVANVPATGPCIVIANHQSHLDPPLIGVSVSQRSLHYVARVGLFKNRFFAWLITTLNALPIRNDEGDIGAIRQVLARLELGHAVLMFPEGARSRNGELQPFKRGIGLLVRKARCPVIPAAVDGCYAAWPRSRTSPRLLGQRTRIAFGEPVTPEQCAGLDVDQITALLQQRVAELHAALRPARGDGDAPDFRTTPAAGNP